MKMAFLGLGTMGFPMAKNLLKAGFTLNVWNRSLDKAQALKELGAQILNSPQQAIENTDIIMAIFSDDVATRSVLMDSVFLQQLKPKSIVVNMTTISVALAQELQQVFRQHQVHFVSAPILGRVNVAEAGKLNILAAGNAEIVAQLTPIFEVLGQKTWYLGEKPEQANAVKLAVNAMIAHAIASMSESAILAAGYDVDKSLFLDLITSTVFSAPVFKGYGSAIATETFEPAGFKLHLGLKDVRLALAAAEQANVSTPLSHVTHDLHVESLAHGDGDLDWAALSQTYARRAAKHNG